MWGQPTLGVRQLCSAIGKGDNAVGNFFTGGGAATAKTKCDQMKAQLASGNVDAALETAQDTCAGVIDTIEKVNPDEGGGPHLEIMVMVTSFTQKAETSARR